MFIFFTPILALSAISLGTWGLVQNDVPVYGQHDDRMVQYSANTGHSALFVTFLSTNAWMTHSVTGDSTDSPENGGPDWASYLTTLNVTGYNFVVASRTVSIPAGKEFRTYAYVNQDNGFQKWASEEGDHFVYVQRNRVWEDCDHDDGGAIYDISIPIGG